MDVVDDAAADGSLDPRIQTELENLNNATDDINKLETELDEAHTAFRQLLSDSTRRLKEILDKLGTGCIEKARCYYEALEVARQAQVKCQQQAQLFQRASEIHAAAKETVALAEARFMSHQHEWNFDQAWQDMLNHATIKVMDAENQKAECGREHHRRALLFHDAEKRLLELEEKHRRSIIKARPYFEVKAQCDHMLSTQKERVECLQRAIKEAKQNYAASLRTLEEISNQIHQQRRDYDIVATGPREPGVGAELVNPEDDGNYDSAGSRATNSSKKETKTKDDKEEEEHLDKRSVDGSEATASQWELELQVSLENLNNLSLENALENVYEANENGNADTFPSQFQTKRQVSESLNNSPVNTNLSDSSLLSRLNENVLKYVPSRVSKFSLKNNQKSRSNNDINLSWNLDVDTVGRYRESKRVLEDKTEKRVVNGNCVKETIEPSCSNSCDKPENDPRKIKPKSEHLETSDKLDGKETNRRPKVTSFSASSTPVRVRNSFISPTQNPTDNGKFSDLSRYAVLKTLTSKTASIKELPLLSMFERSLNLNKSKSCSMVNLDDKKNLTVLLENSSMDNIQAVSAKRLANARDNLFQKVPK